MPKRLAYTHDQFFRDTFADRERALDFLQNYLPSQIMALVDLLTLDIKKDTFINPELQPSYADLLYHLQWAEGVAGDPGLYLYLLFEHKSYADPWIVLQLLDYQNRIWDLWRKQQKAERDQEDDKSRQKAKLPPILPFVFYHGTSQWQVGLSFHDLVEMPEALKPYVPQFWYHLYDLSDLSDQEIIGQVYLRTRLLLMKYILRDELFEKIDTIFGLLWDLEEAQTGLEHLQVMLRYLASGIKKEQKEVLLETLHKTIQE